MSATIDHTASPEETPSTSAARLALKGPDDARGLLDGAWWPRSRDLLAELPALAAALYPLGGRVTRAAVNPRRWPVIPRKVPIPGHVVKVGWFEAELDPHKILLLARPTGRWDLLVVPPEASAATAGRLMAAATDPHGALTASALIAAETLRTSSADGGVGTDAEAEALWESEGGPSTGGRTGGQHYRSGPAGVQPGAAAGRRTS